MSNPPGQPGWGQPPYGEPGPGQPDYSQPGTPNAEPPGYGSPYPSYEQPASGQPAYGQEYGQPPYSQPDPYATQQYSSPPDYPQQYSGPPADQGYGQTQALPAYADPGQPGGPAYPGYPGYGTPPPPPKKSNTGLIVGVVIGVVVLLVCVGTGIGVFALSNADPTASGTPTAGATSTPTDDSTPSDGPSTTDGDKLASRTTDSAPLSLSEFSQSSYSVGSGSFERTGEDESSSCSLAVDGKAKSLVRTLDCSQVASVTAVNSAGCVITFGAINLPDEEAATQAQAKIAGGDSGSFIPRRHGAAKEGQAGNKDWWFFRQAVGHWVIFATGAYASGKKAANDPTITSCDKDFLSLMETTIDKRR